MNNILFKNITIVGCLVLFIYILPINLYAQENITTQENETILIERLHSKDFEIRDKAKKQLGRKAIPHFISIAEDKNEDPSFRNLAIYDLVELKAKEAITPLITLLKDDVLSVRRSAVTALGTLKAKEATVSIINAIKTEKEPSSYLYALYLLKEEEISTLLCTTFKDIPEFQTTFSQAVKELPEYTNYYKTLIQLTAKDTIPFLITSLKSPDPNIRTSAVYLLSQVSDKKTMTEFILSLNDSLPNLIFALKNDESPIVREYSAQTLGHLRDKSVIQPLIDSLKDTTPDLRAYVIRALDELQAKEALPALITLFNTEYSNINSNNNNDRNLLFYVLVKLGGKERLPFFMTAFKNQTLRATAIEALSYLPEEANDEIFSLIMLVLKEGDYILRQQALSSFRNRLYQGVEVSKNINPIFINVLINTLKDNYPEVRKEATYLLAEIGNKEAIPQLLQYLKDEDFSTQYNAIRLLGILKAKEAVPYLIEFLKHTQKYPDSCRLAIGALGNIGDRTATPHLIEILKDKTLPYIPSEIYEALVKLEGKEVVNYLPDILKSKGSYQYVDAILSKVAPQQSLDILMGFINNEDREIRYNVINSLIRENAKEAIPKLILAFKDSSPEVRSSVIYVLDIFAKDTILPVLILALKDQDIKVRTAALSVIIQRGYKETFPYLLESAKDENPEIRSLAISALKYLKIKEAVPYLLEALKDKDPSVRSAALENLDVVAHKEVIAKISNFLKDDDLNVRKSAINALGDFANKETIPDLINVLNDKEPEIQTAAAYSLGKLKSKEAVTHLIAKLTDKNDSVRNAVIRALGEIQDKTAIPQLLIAFMDKNHEIHNSAITALAKITIPDTKPIFLPAFIATIEENPYSVFILQDLIEIGNQDIINILTKAFTNDSEHVRNIVINCIGGLKIKEGLPLLLTALKDKSPSIRMSAVRALGKLGDKETTIPLISQLLQDSDSNVCNETICTLGELGDKESIPLFISYLRENSKYAYHLSSALNNLKNLNSLEYLTSILKDPYPNVRIYAISALESLANNKIVLPKNIRPLLVGALKDNNVGVRSYAVFALSNLTNNKSFLPKTVTPNLINALKDKDPGVRACTVLAIDKLVSNKILTTKTTISLLRPMLKDKNLAVQFYVSNTFNKVKQ